MKKKQSPKSYPATHSPLFRIGTKRKLREILEIPEEISLDSLVSDDMFLVWSDTVKGKLRQFATPKPILKRIHTRIFNLLQRIETSPCLHSGKKGYSAITNAKAHTGETHLVKLDIKSFYPSSSRQNVFSFFKDQMRCASDVADILSKIVTYKGSVPTGSSVSQLMVYFAYKPMFDQIEDYVEQLSAKMTCYVDDITISGPHLNPKQLWEIKTIIRKHGLLAHKFKRYAPTNAKQVTGVVLKGSKALVRNKSHKKIYELRQQLEQATDPLERDKIISSLRGHLNYAGQIEPQFKRFAASLNKKNV